MLFQALLGRRLGMTSEKFDHGLPDARILKYTMCIPLLCEVVRQLDTDQTLGELTDFPWVNGTNQRLRL
jgi:hypothetical protein